TGQSGGAFTDFLGRLNGCTLSAFEDRESGTFGFAWACDWRLPSDFELLSIVDAARCEAGDGSPCIDPIFGPTAATAYWSSFAEYDVRSLAWTVNFATGSVGLTAKTDQAAVRAVRRVF